MTPNVALLLRVLFAPVAGVGGGLGIYALLVDVPAGRSEEPVRLIGLTLLFVALLAILIGQELRHRGER